MSTEKDVSEYAERAGVFFSTWSPGDGVTRYRFFKTYTDYFAGDGMYTALGARESICWLRGYIACRQHD